MDFVATKKPNGGTGVFLAHLMVIAVMVVVLATSFIVYTETLWMKDEIKKEAKELRKLKEEVKKEIAK
jgi:cell division protein FtsL